VDCYGEYMDAAKCDACELREYCKDSSAIDKQSGCFNYEDVAYSMTAPEQVQGSEPAKLLGELLYALHEQPETMSAVVQLLHHVCEIYHSNPLGFSITLTKLLHPEMTYTQIGERHNTSKQLVDYYLKQSVKLVPLLQCAILVDRRRCSQSLTPAPNSLSPNTIAGTIADKFGSLWSFSVESGISYSVIWKAVNRHTKPSGETRKRIAEALDITPLELQLRFRI
jgi:hypothetical protein